MSTDLSRRIAGFGALLGWCAVLLLVRVNRSGSYAYVFLIWNLFLAAIPAAAAWLYARAAERQASKALQAIWFAVWLAFLPNAPYLVTDFLHLGSSTSAPPWYDIALFASCTGTGLLLGYVSVNDVQAAVARRFSARIGWAVVSAALLLSGFGIYLGRFLRWNSWDAVINPLQLLMDAAEQLTDPVARPEAVGVTLVYGFTLLLGYVALRMLAPAFGRGGPHAR